MYGGEDISFFGKHYKVHYKIIEVVANIYKDNYTEIQFGDIRKKREITTGKRQGCTGSTILFYCMVQIS